MEENENVQPVEATTEPATEQGEGKVKEPSKTDRFKAFLRERMSAELGKEIALNTAWELFKISCNTPFDFCLERQPEEDRRLPLAGIGIFEILKAAPRKPAEKELRVDPNHPNGFNPRPRFYPSIRYQNLVDKFYNLPEEKMEQPVGAARRNKTAEDAQVTEGGDALL